MPYKPSHVANSFLVTARNEGISDVDHLKVQKLVYNFHGWFLATMDEPAIGELFEAWPYGPVLSSLYNEFKVAGSRPIEGYAKDIDPATGSYKTLMVNPNDARFAAVFNRVWDRYKNKSGLALSSLTHAPGTPWSLARQRGASYLSNEEIKQHFRDLVQQDGAAA